MEEVKKVQKKGKGEILTLKINECRNFQFQTHQSWSREAEMRREFKTGQAQKDFISNIQNELRKNINGAVHIRVWGEPGIGKTRLVLEATRSEEFQPFVIYCDRPSKFKNSDLTDEVLRSNLILIIDECDPDSRAYIYDKLKYRSPKIKLISIYNEYDDISGNIIYLNVPPLDKEQISNIIQGYGILKEQADRWVEFCSGSPRVAHVFGQNLKNNPENLLRSLDTVNVWSHYVAGGDNPNSEQVQWRQVVLQYIALFKRFRYDRQTINEVKTVAKIIEKGHPFLTWLRFQKIIQDLKVKRILQGENILYITPKALHIKLWIDWWNTYGVGFSFEEFFKNLPVSFRKGFFEMSKYMLKNFKFLQCEVKENGRS